MYFLKFISYLLSVPPAGPRYLKCLAFFRSIFIGKNFGQTRLFCDLVKIDFRNSYALSAVLGLMAISARPLKLAAGLTIPNKPVILAP